MQSETEVIVRLKNTRGQCIGQWFFYIAFPLSLVGTAIGLGISTGYFGGILIAFVAGTRMPYYWAFTKVLVKKLYNRD